jgi:hypothetical protein
MLYIGGITFAAGDHNAVPRQIMRPDAIIRLKESAQTNLPHAIRGEPIQIFDYAVDQGLDQGPMTLRVFSGNFGKELVLAGHVG